MINRIWGQKKKTKTITTGEWSCLISFALDPLSCTEQAGIEKFKMKIRGLFDKFVDNGDNFLYLIRKILKYLIKIFDIISLDSVNINVIEYKTRSRYSLIHGEVV